MLKTILRTVYILAAAAIVFAGLFWYASASAEPISANQPVPGEGRSAGEATAGQHKNGASGSGAPAAGEESIQMGHTGEHFSGDPGVLVMIRNLVWMTGTVSLVLLLQTGWNRYARRKSKVKAGSA